MKEIIPEKKKKSTVLHLKSELQTDERILSSFCAVSEL